MRDVALAIPASVKAVVDGRDNQKCVRCGRYLSNDGSRHHRQRRQVGGHLVVNIILLCGSGTTGCHGWVHANPEGARAEGLIVSAMVDDVAEVPLLILDLDVSIHLFYVRLTADGQRVRVPDDEAREFLALVA